MMKMRKREAALWDWVRITCSEKCVCVNIVVFLGSQLSQTQLYVVREPDGLGEDVAPLLGRPDGSGQVAKVVADLE